MEKIIESVRGDTFKKTLNFTSNGSPLDITGSTVFFTIKKNPNSLDTEALVQQKVTTHTNPTQGVTEINVSGAEMGVLDVESYWYDIQVTLSNGDVATVLRGKFVVLVDVTKDTT